MHYSTDSPPPTERSISNESLLPPTDFAIANQFSRDGNWMEAVVFYRRSLQHHSEFYAIYENLGDALYQLEFWEEAEVAYQQAIELNSKSAWPYVQLGRLHTYHMRYPEAVTAYRRAITLSPLCYSAYSDLANVLILQNHPQEAGKTYRRLAALLRAQGYLPEAIAAYQQALALAPEMVDLYQPMGECFHHQSQLAEAAFCYQASIEYMGTNQHLWNYKTWGEALQSVSQLEAPSLSPSTSWEHFHRGRHFMQQGDIETAIVHYQQCLSLQPNFLPAYTALLSLCPQQIDLYDQLYLQLMQADRPHQAAIVAQLKQLVKSPNH